MTGRLYTAPFFALVSVVGLSFLSFGFVMPLRSLYAREEIGATSVEIGHMASAFLLAGFVSAPFLGSLSDRIGHYRLILLGLALHAVLIALYIPAAAPWQLIALRALEGVCTIGIFPATRALVNEMAGADRQGEALGVLGSARTAGILLGPAAGSLLAALGGYDFAFVFAALSLPPAIPALALLLPERLKRAHGTRTGEEGAGGIFNRKILAAHSLNLLLAIPMGVATAVWSLYMLDRGAPLSLIGLSFTMFALPGLFLSPVVGRLSDRRGRMVFLFWGFLLSGATYFAYGFELTPHVIVALSLVEGLSAALARTALDGFLADHLPGGAKGRTQAHYAAFGTAGSLFGAAGAGYLYLREPGTPFFFEGTLFLAVSAGLLVIVLRRALARSAR